MDLPGVQILVVVARIQMRTLKTDVGNGSMTTAFGHGLVGPEKSVNSKNSKLQVAKFVEVLEFISKGNLVNIPEPCLGYIAATRRTRKSLTNRRGKFSFFFYGYRAQDLRPSEACVSNTGKTRSISGRAGVDCKTLENPRDTLGSPGKTVQITASGLQGLKPLVTRIM